jgi:hypothetical protein
MIFVCRDSLQWARAASFTRFLDHTRRRTIVSMTPLDKWSARRRDLYLKTHVIHNRQTSMPPVGFETIISAGERPQTVRPLGPTRYNDRPTKILEVTFMKSFSVMSSCYYLSPPPPPPSSSSSQALYPVMDLGFQNYLLSCPIPDGLWTLLTCFFYPNHILVLVSIFPPSFKRSSSFFCSFHSSCARSCLLK